MLSMNSFLHSIRRRNLVRTLLALVATAAVITVMLVVVFQSRYREFDFEKLDANRDSRVDSAEYGRPDAVFIQLDVNSDGYVDRHEAQEYYRQQLPVADLSATARSLFAAWDVNSDGKVSATDFPYNISLFVDLGLPAEGLLSVEEFVELFPRFTTQLSKILATDLGWFYLIDKNSDSALDAPELSRIGNAAGLLAVNDLDRDGAILLVEAQQVALPPYRWTPIWDLARLRAEYNDLDANNDGFLESSEMGNAGYLAAMVDQDRNGRIDRSELETAQEFGVLGPDSLERYSLGLLFEELDADRNGTLNEEETRDYRVFWRWLDEDNNGVVTREEFMRLREAAKGTLQPIDLPPREKRMRLRRQ